MGVLAGAGVTAWQMWPSEEATVAVPAHVCESALPGADVKALLPAKGKQFAEWHTGTFNPEGGSASKVPGTCKVYGGGKSVTIKHSLYAGSDYTMKDVARDASSKGATRIALGEAKGFHEGDTTYLFVDCSSVQDETKALVEVDITYQKTTDRAVIQKMASLAADTLRLEAQKLWTCDGADGLPKGSPQVG
ncbi:hypothetical protein [Streptomyces cellostaticus]|uniref:hypothetical protein n=1 Tax=Streptomyces cellostaticus TaxID=67285 RepID=UPI00131DD1D4|nr:hypothetical protein [Streptomyces cellostaticus]